MSNFEQKSSELNVVFSSDNNYSPHLGASIYSLLVYNCDFHKINIYIIDNGIAEENIIRLQSIVGSFKNVDIVFVDFSRWKDRLHLNMAWHISISSYARLFVASMLPEDVTRVIYLDSDVIIRDSLQDMWNYNLNANMIGAVQDVMRPEWKNAVGLENDSLYFNAGVLLINLQEWRKYDIEPQCMKFIDERNGQVIHHDQGVLNGLFKGKWTRLPLRYNLMTIHFFYSLEKQRKYFGDQAPFYTEQEIAEAKNTPAILHFTPSFTSRPWIRSCAHPLRKLYWDALLTTPWKDMRPLEDNRKWYVKLVDWRYRCLPF